jgi:hypothetical protein
VRPELARALQRKALDQGVSVQAFILLALRAAGLPVLDLDLEDLRQGGASGSRRKRSIAERLGVRRMTDVLDHGALSDTPGFADIVEVLAAIFTHERGAEQSPSVVINNCGCREHPSTVNKPVNTRNRKKGTDHVKRH